MTCHWHRQYLCQFRYSNNQKVNMTMPLNSFQIHWHNVSIAAFLFVLFQVTPACAEFDGKYTIALVDHNDQETVIGDISFHADGSNSNFKLDLDAPVFSDHFLSMRPFRCIEGPEDWYCYLPYPYDLRRVINNGDFVDLEYALLFISKQPGEFGIDAWNGRYYKLRSPENAATGNALLEGTLYEVDLNMLAAPPEGAFARPIADKHLTEADANSQRFPKIRIR